MIFILNYSYLFLLLNIAFTDIYFKLFLFIFLIQVCELCGKSFMLKKTLNRHVKIHTGEKLFKCEICYKSFIRKDDLNRHLRIHIRDSKSVDDSKTHVSIFNFLDNYYYYYCLQNSHCFFYLFRFVMNVGKVFHKRRI